MRHLTTLAALAALALGAPGAASAATPCRGFCPEKTTALTALTQTAQAGDVTVGFRSFGTGRPLVLISGLAASMDQWDPDFLDRLAQRHRVVIFDSEGIGRSTQAPGELTVAQLSRDAARLIGALGLKRPDVLGWSLGGLVAQQLALDRPDLVRRLVLCATSPGTPRAPTPTAQALQALTREDQSLAARMRLLFPPARGSDATGYINRILGRATIALPTQATALRQLAALSAWGADPAAALPRLHRLRPRLLVAAGARDILMPVEGSRMIARAVPRAQLVTYPSAGNGFLFQDRVAFAPRVLRFLK